MQNSEPSRARQKIRNRARIRARASTPEDRLERHLDQLLEEQQELQEMLLSHLPPEEDLGEESGYDPDPEDCDQEQDTDVDTDSVLGKLKVESPKEQPPPPPQQPENRPKHVTFADQVLIEPSTPPPLPPLEQLPPPSLPPRTCSHLNNFPRSPGAAPVSLPLALRVGKCTPPKLSGQGYDPPFLYPEFIAKNQQSRVNYIFTLVDSLVLQMERFGKLTLNPEEEAPVAKPSTGAIPKVRSANSQFKDNNKSASARSGSKSRSQSKGKHSKKTHSQPEPEYDMDYELCVDQIDDFRAHRIRGGSHYYFDNKDPVQDAVWEILKERKEQAEQVEQARQAELTEKAEKAEKARLAQEAEKAKQAEKAKKAEKASAEQPNTTKKTFNQWLLSRGKSSQGCEACAAGRTLDVIRGHLSRADYSNASKLPHKRRSNGRDSSSSSSTATLTPSTRPCTPEGLRRPNRPRDLEQLLDPTTDWPATKKRDTKHRRTLENLFNMTPAAAPTRITIVPGKRNYQYTTSTGATIIYPAHRINQANQETTLIPCIKKTNK